jgi:hypothetical protein
MTMAVAAEAPFANRDVFTPEEAAGYLKLPSLRSLETARANGLVGAKGPWKGYMYHRIHLDAYLAKTFGLDVFEASGPGRTRTRR